MSLRLPSHDSSLRELFTLEMLAEWRRLPTFRVGLATTRRFLAAESAAVGASFLCLRADGAVWLVTVGPRGGWRRRWNFGRP